MQKRAALLLVAESDSHFDDGTDQARLFINPERVPMPIADVDTQLGYSSVPEVSGSTFDALTVARRIFAATHAPIYALHHDSVNVRMDARVTFFWYKLIG